MLVLQNILLPLSNSDQVLTTIQYTGEIFMFRNL